MLTETKVFPLKQTQHTTQYQLKLNGEKNHRIEHLGWKDDEGILNWLSQFIHKA
jgi:hypothetical protein